MLKLLLILAAGLRVFAGEADSVCQPELTVLDHFDQARLGITDTTALHSTRYLYESSFDVVSITDTPPFERVRGHLIGWLSSLKAVKAAERQGIARALGRATSEVTSIMVDPSLMRLVVAEPARPAPGRALAVFVEHFDHSRPDLLWRTEIALTEYAGGVHVTVGVLTWRPSGRWPFQEKSSVPRMVRAIFDDRALRARSGAMPISDEPRTVRESDLAWFLRVVDDPERVLPLIYVSRRTESGRVGLDIDRLAEDLRGFATVMVEAEAPFLPFTRALLSARPDLFVGDGAVRLIGTGAKDLGRFDVAPGEDGARLVKGIIRAVTEQSRRHVRTERGTWTNSIFDLVP